MKNCIALIDGEHYIPVTKSALEYLTKSRNYNVKACVFIGGTEKIGDKKDLEKLARPVILEPDPYAGVKIAIEKYAPEIVVDLSDDPVVGYYERFKFANLILQMGVIYEGADFRFEPPVYHDIPASPSMTIIGTAKRVGKTAFGAYTARLLSGQEMDLDKPYNPCIITMGRGGPPEPEIIEGNKLDMNPEYFLKMASLGKHAASDHFEDALLSRCVTIGCRRCGGGFAGVVFYSVVPEGAKLANTLGHDFLIFEGSGPSIPPIETDAWIITVGAHQPIDYIKSFMGPYRIAKSDLAVITMCEEPMATPEKVDAVEKAILEVNPGIRLAKIVFRPRPISSIAGKRVLFTTTAKPVMSETFKTYLEKTYTCEVVGMSHNLSNRPKLREDIAAAMNANPDVLVTEVKAASIDVATKVAVEHGLEVVYADNIAIPVDGEDLAGKILDVAKLSEERFARGKKK